MAITFTPNSDGSITVTWTAPAVNWLSTVDVQSYFNANGKLPLLYCDTPGTANTGTFPPMSPAADAQDYFNPFTAYGILHLQLGTNTANTLKDLFVTLPLSVDIGTLSNGQSYISAVHVQGGSVSYTIPASALDVPLAGAGVYALGYVGLQWVPDPNTGAPAAGYSYYAEVAGTNAQGFVPQPPSTPANFTAARQSDGSVLCSWQPSTPGSAPIAGYTVKWSLTQGGPYTGSKSVSAAPTTLDASNFGDDGKTRYFIVQAFDDGSAPPASSVVAPGTISYWPPAPPKASGSTVGNPDPAPPTNGGGGGTPSPTPQPVKLVN